MKRLFFTLSFFAISCSLYSQMYCTTSIGGNGGGTISSLNPATATLTQDFTFDTHDGAYPAWYSKLLQATDGKLYGVTTIGGSNENGTIFSYDPATSVYAKLYDFDYSKGSQPFGSLIQASDGKLYGMVNNGGIYGRGAIFSFNPVDRSYAELFDFNTGDGESPHGSLIQSSDGKLYGMTTNGGVNDNGVIFSYDINNNHYTKLTDFSDSIGKHPTGDFIQAPDGKLYAMTFDGGNNHGGTILSYNTSTSALTKLIDFDQTNGSNPFGTFVIASDGNFYAMTWLGGGSNLGVVFSYNPVTNTYKKLIDLDNTVGAHPYGSLLQTTDGRLFGMTTMGGSNYRGVLFSYNINSAVYTNLKDFSDSDGAYPYGSLVQSSDNKLYGMTYTGGNGGLGVLFSYNPDSNAYSKLRDFGVNTTGSLMLGGIVKDASGTLYGMTNGGGSYARGVIFSFNTSTSTYSKLLDFNGANGEKPFGSLSMAKNGKLYGMTLAGGVNSAGVIFSFDPSTSTYTKLKDFDNINGGYPYGNLLQATNGLFYGMTNGGGVNGEGVIFSFDPATSAYNKLLDFDGVNGAYPTGSLMQAKDGKLYGATYNGGTNDWGILFSFNPDNGVYTKLLGFDASTSINPNGTLVQASNNELYGMTSYGTFGAIFSYNPSAAIFTKVKSFNYADGAIPKGSLINGLDGKFYGLTSDGGNYRYGVCFSFDPNTNTYTKIQDFNDTNGRAPIYTFFTEITSVLPLNLLSFSATRNGKTNLLNWATAQEINTDNFVIQRSNNVADFTNIGKIQSLSNGDNEHKYAFTDLQPLKAINYYRLKMTDKNGRFRYSAIRSVKNTGTFDLTIYPNPIHQILKLNFHTEKAISAQIDILNSSGKTIYTQELQLPYGASMQNINMENLSNGNYFLKFKTADEQRVLKLTKQ